MSHLTKQQLTDIAKHLNQIGIKDSQFKEVTADNVGTDTWIPLVVHGTTGNENKRITLEEFITYLSTHLDLNKTTIVIDGAEHTLASILASLLGISENPELG